LLVTLFCSSLFAQQPVVAVASFNAVSGISTAEANMITRVFYIRLGNANRVRLVDRTVVDQVIREHQFQLGDWSNAQKTAELGNALNANWVARGIMERFDTNILVTVEFFDMRTFEYRGGADLLLANANEVYQSMDTLVDKVVETIAGSGRLPPPPVTGSTSSSGGTRTDNSTAVPANFVRVEGGTFQMGSASGGDSDERPVHSVTVKSFSMSKYPVTQKEWYEVMGTTIRQQQAVAGGSRLYGEGDNYPMYYVSWLEAVEYCNKRSIKEGLTPAYSGSGNNITCNWNANGYRLPTEAEWEYAAKGGSLGTLVYEYSGSNNVDSVGWHSGNSGGSTKPVGTKAPNSLGLYDMSGNVWEWCWDWYGNYTAGAQADPRGAVSGTNRVMRGGSWYYDGQNLRSAVRNYYTPSYRYGNVGFRLVRP
jgi:formylglycine-generating enzyme required for sulfatase activity